MNLSLLLLLHSVILNVSFIVFKRIIYKYQGYFRVYNYGGVVSRISFEIRSRTRTMLIYTFISVTFFFIEVVNGMY